MQLKSSHLSSMASMHDLRRLQVLVAVGRHSSFSRAAIELGYAQSVVSHHIAALEDEVGCVLVDRSLRPIALTEAGRRLREHAIAILAQVDDAQADLEAIAGLRTGNVRVGAFLAACVTFMPMVVSRFRSALPDVEVHLEQVRSDEALDRVRTGALDLAVIWRAHGDDDAPGRGFATETLAEEPYRIVLPSGHRLVRRPAVSLADLAGEPFSGPRDAGDGARYHAWLRNLCAQAGFTPDCRFPVDDVSVGRAFIAGGLCVGLLPHLTVAGSNPAIVVRELPGHGGFRSIIACWRAGRGVPGVPPMLDQLRGATAELMALPQANATRPWAG